MWHTDIIEIFSIISSLGFKDKRMEEARDYILAKADEKGRWTLKRSFNGSMIANIEQKGRPNKWITLRAIKYFYLQQP